MTDLFLMIAVLAGSFGIGYVLISKVPPLLHTPLMSMTNAISAVTLLGAIMLFSTESGAAMAALAVVAVVAAAFNVLGGFAITDRMLRLFRKKASPRKS